MRAILIWLSVAGCCAATDAATAQPSNECLGTHVTVTAPITTVIPEAIYLDEGAQQTECPVYMVGFSERPLPAECRDGGRATVSGKVGWDDYYFIENPDDVRCE